MRNITRRLKAEIINLIPVILHGLAGVLPIFILSDHPTTWMIAAAFITANLADADTSYSHIGRLLWPLARFIESRFGHRTITHSWLALVTVTAAGRILAVTNAIPWPWWWWPLWYATHLIVDMIIGGKSGVPLLWPLPLRFFFLDIEPGSAGERVLAVILAVAVALAAYGVQIDPARWLHEKAGTLDFALQDYRAWEPHYHVLADIEGTWQVDHRPITGRFEIVGAEGDTLYLSDGSNTFTAGQSDEEVYLRRIVAVKGPPRAPLGPPSPTPEATPVVIKIRIDNVYDPATEILVHAGDTITRGQLIADLAEYRRRQATPTPTPTPTPGPTPTPTPTWQPNPLVVAKAEAELTLARARYEQAVRPPTAEEIAEACAEWEQARNTLWALQAYRDGVAAKVKLGNMARYELEKAEAAVGNQHIAVELAKARCERLKAAQHLADDYTVRVAAAELAVAEVAYRAALATPTPRPTPTPSPTPSPIPLPTPTTDETRIYSLVAGRVIGVRVVAVHGNVATVEVYVELATPFGRFSPPPGPLPTPSRARVSAFVNCVGVSDGDTFHVVWQGKKEKVRLIGVDAPELSSSECYAIQATDFLTRLLLHKTIGLEFDVQQRDKYGRLLAYVWLGDEMVNEVLVREGYARAKEYPPNVRYAARFAQAEREAKATNRGLWGVCR